VYEITITKVFCAAHAIALPDGSTEPVHGHNWETRVTVGASSLNPIEVVMDFHDLEQRVETVIAQAHNRNLNDIGPFAEHRMNPTAERVAWWLGTQVAKGLPTGVDLICAGVGEAPGCWATFRPS
jgi:6-pyruvoyltetrahydropterin/6-carboxytetrahydropterin synthase